PRWCPSGAIYTVPGWVTSPERAMRTDLPVAFCSQLANPCVNPVAMCCTTRIGTGHCESTDLSSCEIAGGPPVDAAIAITCGSESSSTGAEDGRASCGALRSRTTFTVAMDLTISIR